MNPITIILTEGYSDWEIGVLAGIGRAFYGAQISFASPTGQAVRSVGGIETAQLERFEAPEDAVVVVCGGSEFEGETPPAIEDRLRAAREKGSVIAGICGGTMALARAGLLDEVRHTSNGPDYLAAVPQYRGQGLYVDQSAAVSDGGIITAPAPAPASFALEVLVAAGVPREAAGQVTEMLALEHRKARES